MALGVVRVLRENGHSVPDKILVTGFDDIPVAAQIFPTLTTVAQPSFELGVAAVNMVIGLLDGEVAVGAMETLPTTLVVRGSCGCPADRAQR
jgi:DNA-binding LacI/PurR family transcriptional regulator